MQLAYGRTVTERDDHFVSLMEENFSISNEIRKRGLWPVDRYPICKHTFISHWFHKG